MDLSGVDQKADWPSGCIGSQSRKAPGLLGRQQKEDESMLNKILVGIMRNALLVAGLGALVLLNTAMRGG